MSYGKWHLFAIRTQIEMRMLQLAFGQRLRKRIVEIIGRINDFPHSTTFVGRLETKVRRLLREG